MENGAIIDCCENKTTDDLICTGKAYAPILSRTWPVKGSAAVGFGREYCDPSEWKIVIILLLSVYSHRFSISTNSDLFSMSVEVEIYVPTILSVTGDWSSRCKTDSDEPVSWHYEIFLWVSNNSDDVYIPFDIEYYVEVGGILPR